MSTTASEWLLVETSDFRQHRTSRDLLRRHSSLLRDMTAARGTPTELVSLARIDARVFEQFVAWCRMHETDPPFDRDRLNDEAFLLSPNNEEDARFVEAIDGRSLAKLIEAASYLGSDQLLDVCLKRVAALINGLTAAEIRQRFGLVDDWMPEQRRAMRLDPYDWN